MHCGCQECLELFVSGHISEDLIRYVVKDVSKGSIAWRLGSVGIGTCPEPVHKATVVRRI